MDDEMLTFDEIAERCGVSRSTVQGWHSRGELGEPAAVRPQRHHWSVVRDYAVRSGFLDARTHRPVKDRPHASKGPRKPPAEPVIGDDGRTRMYIPHVAKMFGVSDSTVSAWRKPSRDTMLPEPDEMDGRKPVWFEATLRRWGRTTGRLDEQGRPTGTYSTRGVRYARRTLAQGDNHAL